MRMMSTDIQNYNDSQSENDNTQNTTHLSARAQIL